MSEETKLPKPGTPLPWRLEYPLGESEPAIFAGDSNEYLWIATVGHDEDYDEQSAISITKRDCVANAAYIVHACNAYPQLTSQLATVTAERDEARREVERQRHSADIAAHVVVESGYIPGDGCRCEMCREVAVRMSDAGYLSHVKDRWWEAAALNTEGKQG